MQDIANDLPAAECQCHCNPKWPRSRDPSETPAPKRSFREEEIVKSTIHKCEETVATKYLLEEISLDKPGLKHFGRYRVSSLQQIAILQTWNFCHLSEH